MENPLKLILPFAAGVWLRAAQTGGVKLNVLQWMMRCRAMYLYECKVRTVVLYRRVANEIDIQGHFGKIKLILIHEKEADFTDFTSFI